MAGIKRVVTKQLGELLLDRGVISQEQLNKALKAQEINGGLIGYILVSLGYAKEEEIAQALTVQYGFPYLPLECYEINVEAMKLIPRNVAEQYNLIAIDKMGSLLTIAMSNPLNIQAVEDVEMISECTVQVFVSTMSDVTNAITKYYQKK
jgi:type IV pilus assembly protein PilB